MENAVDVAQISVNGKGGDATVRDRRKTNIRSKL
jgi:hypothetical protein